MDEAERYDVEGDPCAWPSAGRWNDMPSAEEHCWVDLMTCAEYAHYYFDADNKKQCCRLLMNACKRGNLPVVNVLLRHGARIDQRHSFNIRDRDVGCDILRALLAGGFRPTQRTLQHILFFTTHDEGANDLARMLVALGADTEQPTYWHGDSYYVDDDVRAELAPLPQPSKPLLSRPP